MSVPGNHDEDIDDILSSIVQSQRANGPIINPVEALELQNKAKHSSETDLSRESMLRRSSEFVQSPKTSLGILNTPPVAAKPTETKPATVEDQKSSLFSRSESFDTNKKIHSPEPTYANQNTQQTAVSPAETLNIPYFSDLNDKTNIQPEIEQTKAKEKRSIKRWVLAVPLVLVFIIGIITTIVIIDIPKPLANLISTPSPFTEELTKTTSYPLLYPMDPPSGFSIDFNSINRAENDIVLYSLTNNKGDTIQISLQPVPKTLNREALAETLNDVRTVRLPAGDTLIGTSLDGFTTAHTLSGSVWVITRVTKDVVPESTIEAMLSTLKES